MNLFREAMKNEQERIQRVIDLTATPEEIAGIGSLAPEKRNQNTYYYEQWYQGRKRVQKNYLGTADSEATLRHLKLRMQNELIKRAEEDQKLLNRMQAKYQDYDPQTLLDALPATYRKAAGSGTATPLFDQRYQQCVNWASQDYERNDAPFSKAATYAKDGTHVRSKGECIYYNILQEYLLPFVYDCYKEFTGERGETRRFCPDFLIRCLSGRLIIIEHLGRLDDLSYAIDFGKKCHWYIRNGFILGKNFFVTSDDVHGGTDSRAILEVVEKVTAMFYNY